MVSFYIFSVLSCMDAYQYFHSDTSLSIERTDILQFSGDESYRIQTWFAENKRHGNNETCDCRNKGLLLLWRQLWVADFFLCFQPVKLFLTKGKSLKPNFLHALFSPCVLGSWLETLWSDLHTYWALSLWELNTEIVKLCINPSVLKNKVLSISNWMPIMYEYFWM